MGIITDILKEIPLSAVLREKLLLQTTAFEAEMSQLKTKISVLEAENTQLKTKVQHLEDKIQKIAKENTILKKRIKDTDEEPPDSWGDIEAV